ncbi:MAG: NUDIX domain-containing protein [Firmicutes bacterium]|jgi:8-oxo-dGTP diphosphatase|nr:NUDIX domain-containing protein [Bacillota bacterium]NBI62036.1 NUDIX domain-containing protein [Clostridiales bacterium]
MQGYNCIMVYDSSRQSLLFCKRMKDPYKGKYNLVGGKIEPGEDGFAAAYRELEEETGITKADITLSHMMDFTYYNQDCWVEIYVGTLLAERELRAETHPLLWLGLDEDFFDLERFAGEGNIGHMVEQVKVYGPGLTPATGPRYAAEVVCAKPGPGAL